MHLHLRKGEGRTVKAFTVLLSAELNHWKCTLSHMIMGTRKDDDASAVSLHTLYSS